MYEALNFCYCPQTLTSVNWTSTAVKMNARTPLVHFSVLVLTLKDSEQMEHSV